MIDQRTGQERARKSYAIRGASAIEDAATNIFYMERADGTSDVAEKVAKDATIVSLQRRKYKGIAPAEYKLYRDPGNLTHTLLGNRPFAEVKRMDTAQKYARLRHGFPGMSEPNVIKAISLVQGVSEQTIKNHLEGK
jgi:hypothetical protein